MLMIHFDREVQHREREKLYIFSSHLGLIRCLTPIRVSAIIYSQAFLDKHRNTTNVILPHELKHGTYHFSLQREASCQHACIDRCLETDRYIAPRRNTQHQRVIATICACARGSQNTLHLPFSLGLAQHPLSCRQWQHIRSQGTPFKLHPRRQCPSMSDVRIKRPYTAGCAAKDVLHVVQESWSHDGHMASRCKTPPQPDLACCRATHECPLQTAVIRSRHTLV